MSTISTGRQATVAVEIGGRESTFETGKLAKQADGAVVVRSGDTMILATAVGRHGRDAPDADFFPLTVDVEERMYAAGKIPGGFFKREGTRHRARDAHRAHDRPPDPAAVAEGLQERGAGDLHRAVGRHGRAARHPRDQRRLRGARDLAAAVPRAGGRGARRRASRASSWSIRPSSRSRIDARSDRRRHARGADDDRGRRRPGAGGDDARGLRARSLGDHPHLRRDRRARPRGRQAEVDRRRAERRARGAGTATPSGSASRRSASREAGADRRASCSPRPHRRSRWTRPRTTSSASCRCATACRCCSRSSGSPRSRAPSASSSRASCVR